MQKNIMWGLVFAISTLLVVSGFGSMIGYVEASEDEDKIERAKTQLLPFSDEGSIEESIEKSVEGSSEKELEPGLDDLADSPWSKFQYDNQNTGLSPHDTSHVDGTEEWRVSLGDHVDSSAVIGDDGTVYIGSRDEVGEDEYDASLHAIEPGGDEKWSANLTDYVSSSPAIDGDGTVYIGSREEVSVGEYESHFHAIEPGGDEKWTVPLGGYGHSSPAIGDDGTLYITSYDQDAHLHAIEPNGEEKWTVALRDYVYSSPAIDDDGTVYVGSYELVSRTDFDAYIHAIEPSGEEKWSVPLTDNIQSSPTIGEDGTVYIGSFERVGSYEYDGHFHAVESDGSIKWSIEMGDFGALDAAIDDDGTIYVGSYEEVGDHEYDGQFHAVEPDGSIKWSIDMDDYGGFAPSIGGDGTVYVTSYEELEDDESNGYIYAVEPDGSIEWSNVLGDSIGGLAIGGDGTIYVGSSDSSEDKGLLHAIDGGEEEHELTIQAEEGGTTDPDPGTETYTDGEKVTVEAIPEDGWVFDEWTGDVPTDEEGASIEFTMDQDRTITAHFEEVVPDEHLLTIEMEGEGSIEVDGVEVEIPYEKEYEEGTDVHLRAISDEGWEFDEWTGDHEGTEEEITITMDDDKEITVHFNVLDHVLTINVDPEEGGTTDPEPGEHTYGYGEEVTVTADPEEDWEFDKWTGDHESEDEEITFTIEEDMDITANFEAPQRELTINVDGQGTTQPETGTHTYNEGEEVTVTAIPNEGWEFEEWTGDHEGMEEEITIMMDDDKEITAHFDTDLETHDLAINVEPEEGGTTDPEEGTHTYEEGTEVTVTADPEENWQFVEWTGDHTGIEDTITINMNDDKTISAHFEENVTEFEVTDFEVDPDEGEPPLDVTITAEVENVGDEEGTITLETNDEEINEWTLEPEESVSVDEEWTYETEGLYHVVLGPESISVTVGDPDLYELTINIEGQGTTDPEEGTHEYEVDEEVTVKATPDEGWYFDEWTGAYEGTEEETTIIMDEDKELTANFEEVVEYDLTIDIDGEGSTDPSEGDHTYEKGTEVTVKATPDEGWYFDEWKGTDGTGEEITITMNGSKEITAVFEEEGVEDLFEITDVEVSDEKVEVGDEVEIDVTVYNPGDETDTQTVEVDINPDLEKDITLGVEDETIETFTWKAEDEGDHIINIFVNGELVEDVDGETIEDLGVTVVEDEEEDEMDIEDEVDMMIVGIIVLIVIGIVLAIVAYMMMKGGEKAETGMEEDEDEEMNMEEEYG